MAGEIFQAVEKWCKDCALFLNASFQRVIFHSVGPSALPEPASLLTLAHCSELVIWFQ